MLKNPNGVTGEAVSASRPTLREMIFSAESDMARVYDLALLLHDKISDAAPISGDMQAALTWPAGDLLDLGKRMREIHEGLYAAIAHRPKPADGAPAEPEADRKLSIDWGGEFHNLANLVAMVHRHFLEDMRRIDDPAGSYYRIDRSTADEALSLLYVADNFAAAKMAEGAR